MSQISLLIGAFSFLFAVASFIAGRYWHVSEKKDDKIDSYEEGAYTYLKDEIEAMETRLTSKMDKLDEKLGQHVQQTERNFNKNEREQKLLNEKVQSVDKDFSIIKGAMDSNTKLMDVKIAQLDSSLQKLEGIIEKITTISPIASGPKKKITA